MGIDWASDNPAGIRTAAAGLLDKMALVGHNLVGVDVPVGASLGMADIPSTVVVDMDADDTVCCVVHSYLDEGTTYFAQAVHKVAEAHKAEDSHSE